MNNKQTRSWPWVSAIILVFAIAFVAGCANAAEGDELFGIYDDSTNTQAVEADAGRGTGIDDYEEHVHDGEDCCDDHDHFDDFDMVVATVNGINITALDVMMEFGSWPINMLVMEYFEMFPDDEDFDFNRVFRDDATFGRVVLEEATRMAAHVKLFYGYANENSIEWTEMGHQHPVLDVVDGIISDPQKFAEFESYMSEMPEEALAYIEKAEAILARALAGEDFATLIETYGEDPGMIDSPEGYTFVSGDMVPSFENATIGLEIGEISGLVMSDFGIHIIMRIEPDPDSPFAPPDATEDELLGAKHILIRTSIPIPSEEDLMFGAVFDGFESKLIEADIVFLDNLDEIPLG